MARITDRIEKALVQAETHSLAALAGVLPASLIEETLKAEGVAAKRTRKLPPDLVTWLVVGMALFRSLGIQNVLRKIVEGTEPFVRFGFAELPCATSIAQARDRLGWKTVRTLFERLAEGLVQKHAPAATRHSFEVYALDGLCCRMPDTKGNDAHFGRPGSTRGETAGFPQLRSVVLVAAWTHVIARVVVGAFKTAELTLANEMLPTIPADWLLLMDRGFYAYAWLAALVARGQPFVVRAKTAKNALRRRSGRRLGRGDQLATLLVPCGAARKNRSLPNTLTVRLVTATRRGFRRRLLATSLLDADKFPPSEIAALYGDRWEAELAYRELKIYQGEKRVGVTFRSHTPDRVLQEFYGLLVAYNCVRALMADAAELPGIEPRRLSFTDCLERVRSAVPALVQESGEQRASRLERLLVELSLCQLPPRRPGRRCARAVKIKMSNYPRKRHTKRKRRTSVWARVPR